MTLTVIGRYDVLGFFLTLLSGRLPFDPNTVSNIFEGQTRRSCNGISLSLSWEVAYD